MEHRHINVGNDEWGVAVIHSIWERGTEDDIRDLIREVKTNPKAADAVRRAFPNPSAPLSFPAPHDPILHKRDPRRNSRFG